MCTHVCVYVCVCVCRLSVCDRIVAWILSQAHGIFSEPYVVTVDPITTVRPLPVSWLGPRSTYVQALQCFLQCTKNPLFIRKSGNAISYFTKSCSSNPCLMTSATGQSFSRTEYPGVLNSSVMQTCPISLTHSRCSGIWSRCSVWRLLLGPMLPIPAFMSSSSHNR